MRLIVFAVSLLLPLFVGEVAFSQDENDDLNGDGNGGYHFHTYFFQNDPHNKREARHFRLVFCLIPIYLYSNFNHFLLMFIEIVMNLYLVLESECTTKLHHPKGH